MALALALAFLVPATAAGLYYAVLTTIGRRRSKLTSSRSLHRFAVLVPAHDEELSLPDSLRSIFQTDYPRGLLDVYVVADNCSDRTAAVARECGAIVLERSHDTDRGKGYALRFGLDEILKGRPDAVLVLDADCQVGTNLFCVLNDHFANGAEAVQVAVVTRNPDDGPTGFVGAIGNAFDNLVSAGKDRLGLSVALRGSGMAFRRDILDLFPWQEYGLTEDADYANRLRRGGVRVRFEPASPVRSETPARRGDLYGQRRRWSAAIFGGSGFLFNWIESKPLVLAQLAATGIALAIANLDTAFVVWYVALVLLTGLVYLRVALTVGLSRRRFGYLVSVPGIVLKLALVTLGGFARRDLAWQRTRRAAEGVPVTN